MTACPGPAARPQPSRWQGGRGGKVASQEASPPTVALCGSNRYPVVHNPTLLPRLQGPPPHRSSSWSPRWEGGTRLDACARHSSGGSRMISEQRRDPLPGQPGARTGQDPSAPSGPSPPVLSTSADCSPTSVWPCFSQGFTALRHCP